jgi:hypothetical protein
MALAMLWFALTLGASTNAFATMNFTIYSQPIRQRYGQVYNKMQTDAPWSDHKFPQDVIARYASGEKLMALTGFTLDMIRKNADGTESPVKLTDKYLHHYILYFGSVNDMEKLVALAKEDSQVNDMLTSCHGMNGGGLQMVKDMVAGFEGVSFGSAAGAEYRHNPQTFQPPYRLLLKTPQVWLPTFHVINTKKENQTVSPLLECPCTPQRKIDPVAGTVDGRKPDPPFGCSPEFEKTGNAACSLETYRGGWRCCEHDMFLIDTDKECWLPGCLEKPVDEVFMKFTFQYEDATPETRDIESALCCDTTGGNIEHDVPACPSGTPADECIFVTENVQTVGRFNTDKPPFASDMVDLVTMAPHLHWAGIAMELFDHETNEKLCEVHRTDDWTGGVKYGTGDEAGNENGYLVGLRPCTWGGKHPKRFRRDHLFRSRSVYNATQYHTGVMSLWLGEVSAVPRTQQDQVLV